MTVAIALASPALLQQAVQHLSERPLHPILVRRDPLVRGAKGYAFDPAAPIDLMKSSTAPHAPSSILHPYLANLGAITTCLRVSF